MADKVFVKNLSLPCRVGVSKEERRKKQNVIIDIEIFCDLATAGTSDDINKTISYIEIQEQLTKLVAKGEFNLLEGLAENIASMILKNSNVSQVKVAVKKEKYSLAPIMGIEITRDRLG